MSFKCKKLIHKKEYSDVVYNDRYGYAIAYYEPKMRDPGLEVIERAKKIVLPKTEKKPRVNLSKTQFDIAEFLKSKELDREIESLHQTCDEAKSYFKKAREFDFNRHEVLFPSYKNRINGRFVDDTIEYMNYAYERNLRRIPPASTPEPRQEKTEIATETAEATSQTESQEDREKSVSSLASVVKKPRPFIKSMHDKYDKLMEQRKKEVDDAIHQYAKTLYNMDMQILKLSRAFKDDKDD